MSARAPRRPGSELAPGYEVLEHLHRSRALDVYDCWSHERECRCIVKGLRPDRRGDLGLRRRLLAEGRLLASLCHPGIVRGYGVLRAPEPLVVMETLTGATLARLIEDRPARRWGRASSRSSASGSPRRSATCTGRDTCTSTSSRPTWWPSRAARS